MFKYNRAQLPTTFDNFFIKALMFITMQQEVIISKRSTFQNLDLSSFKNLLSIQVAKYRMIFPKRKNLYHFPNLKKFTKTKLLKITSFKIKART